MSTTRLRTDPVTCMQVVELVTDYLEHALTGEDHGRVEDHLAECPECVVFLEQIQTTLRMLRVLSHHHDARERG